MGLAVSPRRLAVGTRREVWFFQPAGPELARDFSPDGRHDGAFLVRSALHTGTIAGHDIAWCGDELWVVNTLFSCLCTLSSEYHFVPRWQPRFISRLAPEDCCHLNGLACDGQRPRYVTAIGATDLAEGWRAEKATAGCIMDVASGELVARGLSMPHSPRLYDGRLWVLNSGLGQLSLVDTRSGAVEAVAQVPGYTRGLAFHGPYAFVGLSQIRESNVFGGLPIAEQRREPLVCGLGVIDLRTGQTVATFVLRTGVQEIFAVEVVPLRCLALRGPVPDADQMQVVWLLPPLAKSSSLET